jgi:hypothetical protein
LPKCLKSGASLIAELAQNSVSIVPVSDSTVRIREWHAILKDHDVDSKAMLNLLICGVREIANQLAILEEEEHAQIKTGGMELAKGLFLKSPDATPNLSTPTPSTSAVRSKKPSDWLNLSDSSDDEISNSSMQTQINVKSESPEKITTPIWTSTRKRACRVCCEKFTPLHKENLVCKK